MWKILVILILESFVYLGDCNTCIVPICPKDTTFVQCKGCPKTCNNMYLNLDKCTEECQSGCVCNQGLVKSSTGKCIPPSACPQNEVQCPINQVYSACGAACIRTCENMMQVLNCPYICKPGCVCKEGYYMNKKGDCVTQAKCPPEEVQCPQNRMFSICGAGCPITCENVFSNRPREQACKAGCICKPPLVQNKAGICIEPSQCPATEVVCPPTKIFTSCGAGCPVTCRNMYDYHPCPKICKAGCICKPGEIPNSQDICVPPAKCLSTEISCPPDTVYSQCGALCIKTCDNMDQPLVCPEKCTPGCVCKPGLVLKDGICILPTHCPPKGVICPPTQVYTRCDAGCTKTCENMYLNMPCPRICKPGCTCLPGFVRNKQGFCVLPSKCPVVEIQCPPNRIYSECGVACPITCENVFLNRPHPQACTPGCICAPPLVQTKLGTCVNPSSCPSEEVKCPATTVFTPCGAGCITTCENLYVNRVCTKTCTPGCICKSGEVMDKNGKCILPSQCPTNEICCPPNKVFTSCGSGCPLTCKNMFLPRICPLVCKPGCLCKEGLVENKNGLCVPPLQCGPEEIVCPENQVYTSCGAACPVTCENVYLNRVCPKICKAGCICAEGYVMNNDGKCIKSYECPPHEVLCPPGRVYTACGASCPVRCENMYLNQAISQGCKAGCICKAGMVEDKAYECIYPEECPPIEIRCPYNQVYTKCGAACTTTCENMYLNKPCPKICKPGCTCKAGEVMTKGGKCVVPQECPPPEIHCPQNRIFSLCGAACQVKCENMYLQRICPEICKRGCICKEGYVEDKAGKCVAPTECPVDEICCPYNQVYTKCGAACQTTCSNLYMPRICPKICKPGCGCKEGYVMNREGKCVAPLQCPPTEIQCPEHRIYTSCGTACPMKCADMYLNRVCTAVCKPGCMCKPGMVENKEGKCVYPVDCPHIEIQCPHNQVFTLCGAACIVSCENMYLNRACPRICKPGCACRDGEVMTKYGKCVTAYECPLDEIRCPETQVYTKCDAMCPLKCENMYLNRICPKICKPGCICKKGEVMDKFGRCIPAIDCPVTEIQCPYDEVYSRCGAICQATCDNMYLKIACAAICTPGCICMDGKVRNKEGKCVYSTDCRPDEIRCPPNQVYTKCGAACPNCVNAYSKEECRKICKPGCICKDGMVFNKEGHCVLPYECNPNVHTRVITRFIKHQQQISPPKICPYNLVYTKCGAQCRKTCSNSFTACWNKPNIYLNEPCTGECVSGCVCKDNEVLTNEGKCVPPELCPEIEVKCPSPMIYDSCKKCYKTCDAEVCTTPCKCGCYCPENLVYNIDTKTCYDPYECPNSAPNKDCRARDPNSEFKSCGSSCPQSCPDSKKTVCTDECVKGCFCKNGYVLNATGICVLPKDCPPVRIEIIPVFTETEVVSLPQKCPNNLVYAQCGAQCRKTCSNVYLNLPCTLECKPGCVCRDNEVLTNEGKCVPPELCPEIEVKCPSTMIYDLCRKCQKTCDGEVCTKSCKCGCYCPENLVYNSYTKTCTDQYECPNSIPNKECQAKDPNSEFKLCGSSCASSCPDSKKTVCKEQCVKGCFCKNGYLLNATGICVLARDCPPIDIRVVPIPIFTETEVISLPQKCPNNLVYAQCGAQCRKTCSNVYLNLPCTLECRPGCVCKDNEVLTNEGKCVPPELCPEIEVKCPSTMIYDRCRKCQKTCDGEVCTKSCQCGCYCPENFVYNSYTKTCTDQYECPNSIPNKECQAKDPNSEFKLCGSSCASSCPDYKKTVCKEQCVKGCFCKNGYLLNATGICVLARDCPPIDIRVVPIPIFTETEEISLPQKCPNNLVYAQCGAQCRKTCSNFYLNLPCSKECQPGCVCKDNEVLTNEGKCVPPELCPIIEVKCPGTMIYERCRKCQKTCDGDMCTEPCKCGCYCPANLVYNIYTKTCTDQYECPNSIPNKECRAKDPNSEFKMCGSSCPQTCPDAKKTDCTDQCVKGCFCKNGYVLNAKGICVLPKDCPPVKIEVIPVFTEHKVITLPIRCQNNQVYAQCGAQCPKTCSNVYLNEPCTKECQPGCVCKDNEVLTNEGKCVSPELCPEIEVKCPSTMVYDTCRKCENTCDGEKCWEPCKCGCYCPKNLVYNSYTKTCTDQYECPNSIPNKECRAKDPNTEFKSCGSSCPPSCPDSKIRACTLQCVKGCFCKNGYVLNAKGICVLPKDCPPVPA